jgi:hypothetical protein
MVDGLPRMGQAREVAGSDRTLLDFWELRAKESAGEHSGPRSLAGTDNAKVVSTNQ